ncbi:MAG: patatin-like phospholipase family protein [Intrasporangium sp.]|uniref:patatin-like phospholipase family protein n=1 Tax=Intrasporangium sp. TaxID=1925024 RepID=UPI002649D7A5|nr:patatin-like phospholipase family protein [Intrasporangium sp.]MDN5795720.1 patatin-like phospholipase family protein [Intrasporangium sp.]
MTDRLRAAVVLGSGGARGYAHVGGLQVLDERGFDVVAISGTSMGALVGGVAAAGKLDVYTEWSLGLTQREVFRLLDLTLSAPGGAFRAERIIAKVGDLLEGAAIEDLPIRYTAVATDLLARREVWFQRGPVVHAIRASIAIPGVITPVVINGRTLVDGGLMNPVPIEPTAAVSADVTVAIDLSGTRTHSSQGAPVKETSEERPFEEWTSRLRRGTVEVLESERLRALASRFTVGHRREADANEPQRSGHSDLTPAPATGSEAALPDATSSRDMRSAASPARAVDEWVLGRSDIRTIDLLAMSFETMSALISRYRMAGNPPDILVRVPSNAVGTLDFHRAGEMIALGRQLMTEALDRAGY